MEIPSLAAGRPVISGERKTASASESLAHNLAANATNGEKTVHAATMGQPGGCRQGRRKPISAMKPPRPAWLIIINVLGLSNGSDPLIDRCSMRPTSAFLACAFLLAASAASAESRVFI